MKRAHVAWVAAVIVVVVGAALAWRVALETVRERIVLALGPGAQLEAMGVGFGGIEIRGVSVPGGRGWPADQALRAARVRVVPALRTALSETIVVHRVTIEEPYVSLVRTREGRLELLPTIVGADDGQEDESPSPEPAARPRVRIGRVSVEDGEVEIFDRTVGREPWRLRLSDVTGSVENLEPPALASRMPFQISGKLDGPQRDGMVVIDGWFEGSTQELKTDAKLRGVDLLALEPYVVQSAKVRLARGTFDLSLDASVRSRRLHAPGHLELADLAFKPGSRPTDLVLGVPRDALVKALAARDGRIALDFTLEGDVDDPRFSLNEKFATEIAVAMVDTLGLTVGGLVENVGEIGAEGLSGAGKAAKDVGRKLKGLLGR